MKNGWRLALAVAALVMSLPFFVSPQGVPTPPRVKPSDYVDSRVCASCHSKIYERYQRTGMARSFYRPGPANTVEDYRVNNNYYHRASDTHFTMIERGGKYYQRRYQVGFQGEETNIDEKEIDFVMGSGSHARTYLHRTRAGALLELPLAWYAEKGGYWAMNPGYDKPDQPNARRKISLECMFCHNAYPDLPSGHDQLRSEPVFGGALPEGIDCQRCHGPGRRHVQAAQATGATGEAISQAIVNPARLTPARQMEVCMQCHLETTSFPFPHSILRYDRGPFSYQPGEPLGDFMLFFDHPPGGAQEDRLQIVNSVYRLEMSACFRKSNGKLQCTTCHDPHGEAAPKSYQDICRRCHATSFRRAVESGQHTASADCVRCHMPKRRTDDVVHAIMTDHFIQRRKPERDLLAEMPEPNGPGTVYHGRVLPYYPVPFERTAEGELYLALAQVRENNNSDRGIAQFAAAIAKYRPRRAEFYVELADARLSRGDSREATKLYEEAVRRKPDSLAGLLGLGRASEAARQVANAAEAFLRATQLVPGDALPWRELGQIRAKQAKHAEAVAALEESLRLDAEAPETHYALGTLRAQQGNSGGAEASFREAIRLKPDYAEAHMNLAILLFQRQRVEEAGYHFKSALRVRPDYLLGRLNYALMLNNVNRADEARTQLEAALRADPNFAQAHEELGKMAESAGRMEEAFNEYAEAVRMRPQLSRSQLGLGAALARNGNLSEAAKHLRQAATSSDAAVREAALRLLAELGQ